MLETDERLRAGEKLWAVGDITGKGAFTHVSMYQAAVVVRDILGEDGPWADYRAVSRVTFTTPEVASVGLSEAKAREQLDSVEVALVEDLGARGWIAKEEGLIKLVADASRGMLVGATVVGPERWGDPRPARSRRTRRDPGRHAAHHALRLPDVPPRHRDRPQRPRPLTEV